MVTRLQTAVIREQVSLRVRAALTDLGRSHVRTIYHPTRHTIYAYNFGSRVRPNVAPIRVNTSGFETLESYLARGGRILTGAPKVATGAALVRLVRSRSTKSAKSRG